MNVVLFTAKPNNDNIMFGHRMAVDEKRPPTGLGYLSVILQKNGHNVLFIDRYCGNNYWINDNFASFDCAGIYCATVCSDDINNIIQKLDVPNIIVGGPHANIFPKSIPSKVNTIVRGEAEHIINDLVLGNVSDKIVDTSRLSNNDLDNLPMYPYDFFCRDGIRNMYIWDFPFDKSIYPVFTMNTSRGCPFSCSFCSTKKIWGRRWTTMSSERIYEDIKFVSKLGAKGIYFREDNFTVNNKRVYELCNLMRNDGLKWACETRVDTVDESLLKVMAESGCIGTYIGVESLSQHMLDVFGKKTSVDQIVNYFLLAKKYNIRTAASLIVNHPEETQSDKNETQKLLNIIKPTMVWKNDYRSDG